MVEDNLDDQQLLLELIALVPFLTLAGSFDDPVAALPFLTTEPIDLLLLDIQLPGLSGFELLRSLPNPPVIILTTSSLADSLEAFDVGVIDYLVKPFRYERFLRAVNRVLSRQSEPVAQPIVPSFVWLKQGYTTIRVAVSDILYIEAFGAYAKLHTANGQVILVSHLLTDLETKLPASEFARVHKSFLVAVPHITTFASRQVVIGKQSIPVGRVYQNSVRQLFNQQNQN